MKARFQRQLSIDNSSIKIAEPNSIHTADSLSLCCCCSLPLCPFRPPAPLVTPSCTHHCSNRRANEIPPRGVAVCPAIEPYYFCCCDSQMEIEIARFWCWNMCCRRCIAMSNCSLCKRQCCGRIQHKWACFQGWGVGLQPCCLMVG